jgi:succinyl-CoA synthetase beta subunit
MLGSWEEVEPSGNIGILGNGAGLVMATLDLVTDAGSKPAYLLKCRTRAQLKYITSLPFAIA